MIRIKYPIIIRRQLPWAPTPIPTPWICRCPVWYDCISHRSLSRRLNATPKWLKTFWAHKLTLLWRDSKYPSSKQSILEAGQRKEERLNRRLEDCENEDLTVAGIKTGQVLHKAGWKRKTLTMLDSSHWRPHFVGNACRSFFVCLFYL